MDWYVIRHPELGPTGVGVQPASALEILRANGWIRVSDVIPEFEKDQVVLSDYADKPDLDAPATKPAKPSQSKES